MNRMRRRFLLGLAAVLSVTGLVFSTGTAHAAQQQICGNEGSGYCMNNWNGANQYVKMYYGNSSHEDFGFIFNITECGGGRVTSNCPFADKGLDNAFKGDAIGQIEYWPTGQCIGTTSAGTAWLGNCANNSGVGGGTGSTLIDDNLQTTDILIDRYWSDYYSSGSNYAPRDLYSGGSLGAYLYLNGFGGNYTVWGGA
jgi:hypothetical protein